MCSVIGRSYSPVSTYTSIDVSLPTFSPTRDPSEEMIQNIGKHISIIRVLWKISNALYSGTISFAYCKSLEGEVRNATSDVVPPLDPTFSQNQGIFFPSLLLFTSIN